MDWVLRSPQIHSTFSNLGFMHADEYHINENCNAALETILNNILTEDKYLRTYRRSISFGKNVEKDLIPLLIHAKEDKTIELLVTILVNLSIPIECLLSVEATSQCDFGLQTIWEINQLLAATKVAFTGPRAIKAVVDFLKKNVVVDQPKVSPEHCTNISNSLLLLRNLLHIPDDAESPKPGNNEFGHSVQNQILWNMSTQNIDKVLIKLMTMPEATNWAVTMVQLVSLLYKDQRVGTIQKLLNIWLESSTSESSEDDESNTTPSNRGRGDSSPMLTSDPTSDSSDTCGTRKCNDEPNYENNEWGASTENTTVEGANQTTQPPLPDEDDIQTRDRDASTSDENMKSDNDGKMMLESSPTAPTNVQESEKTEKKAVDSETSDCGRGTQIENQESVSTSSNDDEIPSIKPVHQKPHNPKQRVNTKARTGVTLQAQRRKIVKRGRVNSTNVPGLAHQTPTDDNIANVLKEFTVDFLLKGFNSLVQALHSQLLTNLLLEIDTSHFFWLVTYFMKFATQIKLDFKQISGVLSFDIVSYLTAEGVNLCEQFELAVKLNENDLQSSRRRLHLVVTAIREVVQAIEAFQNFPHISAVDKDALLELQNKISEIDELRSLLVLLLRHYNPKHHTKQYLQDLVVTNHILLIFVDNATRNPNYTGSMDMADHIKQFATPKVIDQYGLLLEDYAVNGEYINDCVFTLMHHLGGQRDILTSLYQPKILETFTSILESEFEICDEWSDLIKYVINTFIKRPKEQLNIDKCKMAKAKFFGKKISTGQPVVPLVKADTQPAPERKKEMSSHSNASKSSSGWNKYEPSSLNWIYLQCSTLPDVVGEILRRLKEDGTVKSRASVIRQLYRQNIINKEEFEKLSKAEVKPDKSSKDSEINQLNREMREAEIRKICEQLRQDEKSKCFGWIQQVLLETCYAKVQIEKKYHNQSSTSGYQSDILQFKLFNQELSSPVMSPVSYHALLLNQPIPLVPWNCEQAAMCKDLKFLQLLHKLDFQMPVDTGKVFIRIPHIWSADVLYKMAGKVAVIDTTKLKFPVSDMTSSTAKSTSQQFNSALPTDPAKDVTPLISAPYDLYYMHQQKHLVTMMNFTPRPGSSINLDVQKRANKRCWLEMVQQSQKFKATSTVGSVLDNVEEKAEAEVEAKAEAMTEVMAEAMAEAIAEAKAEAVAKAVAKAKAEAVAKAKTEAEAAVEMEPAPDLPECLSPKEFIAQLSEDQDSVSDTASVVSDLTRMYVSDEDEKVELVLRPSLKTKLIVENSMSDTEGVASKRPRGFSISF